jgi:hypothetical protein
MLYMENSMSESRQYHGWILVEDGGQGFKDYISVEWTDENGNRRHFSEENWRGESGAAKAVEWWDKKLGVTAKLQPALRGSYRVYTEV